MTKHNGCKWACVLGLLGAISIASQAQVFTTLLDFNNGDGAVPQAGLAQGKDGNLYGTTSEGGASNNCEYDCGTVFNITPDGSRIRSYSFCTQRGCPDGYLPYAGLILNTDGNFYGTTGFGGSSSNCPVGCGTIFRISTQGSLTTIHSFDLSDGYFPTGLVQSINGELYGTTIYGGNTVCNNGAFQGCGTVFKITTDGTFTSLHNFNSSDGEYPYSALIQATDGSFYGQTSTGGVSGTDCISTGCGTVFRISSGGTLTTLHSFVGADGSEPLGALLQATDGTFYGTTVGGGTNFFGTVFNIRRDGAFSLLHSFDEDDGANPNTGVIQATDGNFYGTTFQGGSAGHGTIFQINSEGALTILHSFCSDGCMDGFEPELAPLVQDTNGILYGTVDGGGKSKNDCGSGSCGTIFSLNMGLGSFVTFVQPFGRVGQTGGILGQGFTGTTSVMLNGVSAQFNVVSDTYLTATVPPGATTGYVTVTTPTLVLTSNVPFHVIP